MIESPSAPIIGPEVAKKRKPEQGSGARKKEARFEVRAEREWLDRVERQAARFGLTLAAYARMAMQRQLETDEGTEEGGGDAEVDPAE